MAVEKNISQFDKDVTRNQGYVYTTNQKLSSLMANRRQSEAVRRMMDLKGKRVLDVGCGDGTYTLELWAQKPLSVLGVDASREAVQMAKQKGAKKKGLQYRVLDAYEIGRMKERFDVAIVRGVLHHLYDAPRAIEALSKVTRRMIVVEPNGYNPVLKLIERFSSYHVEHEERSYFPPILRGWFRKSGGTIEAAFYCGLVPFFCPDGMARVLKVLEPWVERTPLVKQLSCAVGVYRVSFPGRKGRR